MFCADAVWADCGQVADLKHTMHYEFMYKATIEYYPIPISTTDKHMSTS